MTAPQRPKIVVLDGYTTNPGDLSWGPLQKLGDCEIHDHCRNDQIVSRCGDAEIVAVTSCRMDRDVLEKLPRLKLIARLGTGYNNVDIEFARSRGIVVCNVPNYSTICVAQTTFALLLELCHNAGKFSDAVRAGKWNESVSWAFGQHPTIELHGLTIGLVGLGNIGQAVAKIAQAFGMRVLVNTPRPKYDIANIEYCDIDTLATKADVLSLHCPLLEETRGLINSDRLAKMKSTSFIINTARGALIDEQAMADALNSGKIAGAAMDVLTQEPPNQDNPLLKAKNCIIIPHLAWVSANARKRLIDEVAANIAAFLDGKPRNAIA